jgi:hypothetical protein
VKNVFELSGEMPPEARADAFAGVMIIETATMTMTSTANLMKNPFAKRKCLFFIISF